MDAADPLPAMRIIRFGFGHAERQLHELAGDATVLERRLQQLARALHANIAEVPPPPSVAELCAQLDRQLVPRLDGATESWFGGSYSYLYGGASAFVHPTPTGIEPLIMRTTGRIEIAPARTQAPRVLEVIAEHVEMAMRIATSCAPWPVGDAASARPEVCHARTPLPTWRPAAT